MTSATGRTFDDEATARKETLALKKQGLKAVLVGPLNSAYIVGPAGKPLDWPPSPNKGQYLVIGTDAAVEQP